MSCDDCEQWWYGEDWKPLRRGPQKVPRPPGQSTPCRTCPKVPHDVREAFAQRERVEPITRADAVELSPENARVYLHYLECKGVAWQVPDAGDPLVRRHAGILRRLEERRDRDAVTDRLDLLGAVFSYLKATAR